MNSKPVNGILNLYKPQGITSQTAVRVAKRVCSADKAGHCGTLDPQATGVLPIMLGEAVKISEFLVEHDKHYKAELVLGYETDTEDTTGNITLKFDGVLPAFDQVNKAVNSFVGDYMQVPPMYSALKVDGVKLVDLAREGVSIERQPRQIKIHSAILTEENGRLWIDVHCSRGTYIRTLCADIGRKLGCYACMGQLERASVGRFSIDNTVTLEQLREMSPEEIRSILTPIDQAVDFFPAVTINDFSARLIKNGCAVDIRKMKLNLLPDNYFRLYDKSGFFAVGYTEIRDGITVLRQKKLFSDSRTST